RPGTGPFSFNFSHKYTYNSILLDHQAIQTRKAVSRVRGNYHLFLVRNQPRKPLFNVHIENHPLGLGARRVWRQVPRMR
ncbi:hypothetical protein A1O7_00776, partial [Cladophialophora yegresii CBS 114405]